ncbi:MAG: hypothetical protein AAGA17_08580 [Actinomycetota bacterium]
MRAADDDPLPPFGARVVERPPNRWIPAVAALVVIAVIVGLGVLRRDDDADGPPPTTAATALTVPTPRPPAPTSTTTALPAVPATTGAPGVALLPGVEPLDGRIALAPSPGEDHDTTPMWIVDGDRLLARFDLATEPGTRSHPLLFAGGSVAFVDGGANVQLVAGDASSMTTWKSEETVRALVPAATPGEIWAVVDDGADRVAAVGTSGQIDLGDDVDTVLGGVADGVVLRTATDPQILRYVSPGTEPVIVTSARDPDAVPLATSGDLLVVVEPGPQLTVIDVRTDERTVELPLDRDVTRACFSADRSRLALGDFSRDGPVTILDLVTGERFERFPDQGFGDMAWASDDELVIVDGTRLVRFDADGGGGQLAELSDPSWPSGTGPTVWWIASELAPC